MTTLSMSSIPVFFKSWSAGKSAFNIQNTNSKQLWFETYVLNPTLKKYLAPYIMLCLLTEES